MYQLRLSTHFLVVTIAALRRKTEMCAWPIFRDDARDVAPSKALKKRSKRLPRFASLSETKSLEPRKS